MLFPKRLIVWGVLLILSLSQFVLYLPATTCTNSKGLRLCAPQFTITVIGGSSTANEFIASVREFLRLISYLTIDMGWSNEFTDPSVYEDENLVDTFQPDKVFELNYFGFCKRSNKSKVYCTSNENYGMDVLEVLVRDVGIQLGNISTTRSNETKKFGDSLVLTYRLALTSIRDFLKHDKHTGNALSKALIGSPDPNVKGASPTKNYLKGVNLAFILMMFNGMVFYFAVLEIIVGFISICVVSAFGGALSVGKRHRLFPMLLKSSSSILVVIATLTILCNIVYLIALKTLEPEEVTDVGSDNAAVHTTGWELLKVNVGSGFIMGLARYAIQWVLLVLAFLAANHYKAKPKKSDKYTEDTSYSPSPDLMEK
ncbi:Sma2p [Saccharomyces cerevisiae YJM1460]|nr:Sma2p [Saccharomyces cerevisiae YJM1460]